MFTNDLDVFCSVVICVLHRYSHGVSWCPEENQHYHRICGVCREYSFGLKSGNLPLALVTVRFETMTHIGYMDRKSTKTTSLWVSPLSIRIMGALCGYCEESFRINLMLTLELNVSQRVNNNN